MFRQYHSVIAAVCLAGVAASNPLVASAAEPAGCYAIDGKFSASVNAPGLLKLSLSTLKMSFLNISNGFSSDGSFVMNIPMLGSLVKGLPSALNGSWQMTNPDKGAFSASMTDLQTLVDSLQTVGISASVTKNKFTGAMLSQGNIKGAFELGVQAALPGLGTAKIALNGSYTGAPDDCATDSSLFGALAGRSGEETLPSALTSLLQQSLDAEGKVDANRLKALLDH